MHGYLDAQSRYSKDSLNLNTETIIIRLMLSLRTLQGSSNENSYG